jgi:preprotein translocase subunit Sec63
VTKENFKRFGHPDGNQKVVTGLAIHKSLCNTKGGRYGVLLGWLVILTLICPCCIGAWRTRSGFRSIEGISLQDLYHLFLTDKQNFGLDFGSLIRSLSKCQEVTRIVQRSGILKFRNPNQLQRKQNDMKCCQIAEILIRAHSQGQQLPAPFEKLKDDLLAVYIKLAVCLLKLLSQTKQLYFFM